MNKVWHVFACLETWLISSLCHKTITVRAFETHYWHLEIKRGVEYLLYGDSQQFVYEEVWLLKDVKNDLCAHVDFMVLSTQFNFYSHSN